MPAPAATMKPRNKTVAMTMFSILSEETHTGLNGHSGARNAGFGREAISLVRAATFLLLQLRLELPCGTSAARLLDAPGPTTKVRQRWQAVRAAARDALARHCVDRELIRDRREGVHRFSTKSGLSP
jgi:hypothetical protein